MVLKIYTKNIGVSYGLVNGSFGTLIKMSFNSEEKLPIRPIFYVQ